MPTAQHIFHVQHVSCVRLLGTPRRKHCFTAEAFFLHSIKLLLLIFSLPQV